MVQEKVYLTKAEKAEAAKKEKKRQKELALATALQTKNAEAQEKRNAKAQAGREKEKAKADFLSGETNRIKNQIDGLIARVEALRAHTGNQGANCGDNDVSGVEIEGGSGKNAKRFAPTVRNNGHGITIADVNHSLSAKGYQFEPSKSADDGAKYRCKNKVFVHV